MHYYSFKVSERRKDMKYIEFENRVKEMGYECEIHYDKCTGYPLDSEIIVENGWISTVQKDAFAYNGSVSTGKEAHLTVLMSQLAKTPLLERVVEKEFVFPLPVAKTTYGCRQYLSNKGNTFFISRKLPPYEGVKQVWKYSELDKIPLFYLKLATEKTTIKEWR